MRKTLHRRELLLASAAATVPLFLQRSAQALAPKRGERVLVVLQLSGGNDGLNTLVPFTNDLYYKARPNLAVPAKELLRLSEHQGLHPQLQALRGSYDDGLLGFIQGVGYPNQDRSHFRSMEIWHTAKPEGTSTQGWLGHYCDAQCRGADPITKKNPTLAVNIGEKLPLALAAQLPQVVTLENPALLDWHPGEGGESVKAAFRKVNAPEREEAIGTLDFLQRTAFGAQALQARLLEAAQRYRSSVVYPEYRFCQSLKLVAQMIAAELPTRIYYVDLPGFDTHAAQSNRHAALLQELSEGLSAFLKDLKGLDCLDRTLVLGFSEFGRRVAENQSGGTDHGAGNLGFLAGGKVRGGIHGSLPSLSDLQEGDLKHTSDFRALYNFVLTDWLGASPEERIPGNFSPLTGLLA